MHFSQVLVPGSQVSLIQEIPWIMRTTFEASGSKVGSIASYFADQKLRTLNRPLGSTSLQDTQRHGPGGRN